MCGWNDLPCLTLTKALQQTFRTGKLRNIHVYRGEFTNEGRTLVVKREVSIGGEEGSENGSKESVMEISSEVSPYLSVNASTEIYDLNFSHVSEDELSESLIEVNSFGCLRIRGVVFSGILLSSKALFNIEEGRSNSLMFEGKLREDGRDEKVVMNGIKRTTGNGSVIEMNVGEGEEMRISDVKFVS